MQWAMGRWHWHLKEVDVQAGDTLNPPRALVGTQTVVDPTPPPEVRGERNTNVEMPELAPGLGQKAGTVGGEPEKATSQLPHCCETSTDGEVVTTERIKASGNWGCLKHEARRPMGGVRNRGHSLKFSTRK